MQVEGRLRVPGQPAVHQALEVLRRLPGLQGWLRRASRMPWTMQQARVHLPVSIYILKLRIFY